MAKITLNGVDLEVPEGAPLVEVIKNQGIFISNLCYIDGLPPYAGCRTCLVEIEGARGLQLSCTTKCADGMIVRTNTKEVLETRQAVLSLIMSYHSDRCLTCHRVVKCKPGDTCLRDDTVTHRCLTCSKNYRCELQTTCEMLQMAGYEPWDGDTRTYYTMQHPEPDQANPFLEFDPQMCIICTRCVRACDEIRHTGAITLAGRGPRTRIAFGAGGPVHESNCDFCGTCIDVCPTATLMEHPNKWSATQTERWTPTTCTQCSVGCSIFLGTRKGRGVIVRPDAFSNPVSKDQLCVRGRFHYDAVKDSRRLHTPLIKRNGGQDTASWDEALEFTAARIAQVREEHGPTAIGFLASPFATNEENYLLGKIARSIVGTNHIDSSAGPVARAAAASLRNAFGSEVLPADMTRLAASRAIIVVADDLESSHNVAALRIKDAVVRGKARAVVISPLWNELVDFAEVWVRPAPGGEAAAVAALAAAVEQAKGIAAGEKPSVPQALIEPMAKAVEILASGAAPLSVVYALPRFGAEAAGATVAALANIAIVVAGAEAAQSLFVLPQEANVTGMRDMGAAAGLLPGHRLADDAGRTEMQRIWGAQLPSAPGLTFEEMSADGKVKALIILQDNPLMLAPNTSRVRKWLENLEFLAVIDSLPTDTAAVAHAVLPAVSPWAREGTTTSADRRVLRLNPGPAPQGEARQGWRILTELGARLAERLQPGEIRINYQSAAEIMEEIAQVVPLYQNATYREMDAGAQQFIYALGPNRSERQPVPAVAAPPSGSSFTLTTGRGLYTSYEAAAIHDTEADLLHREDAVRMHPDDAAALGVTDGDTVIIRNDSAQITVRANLTEAVQPKSLHLPLYYDGGAVAALFDADTAVTSVDITRA